MGEWDDDTAVQRKTQLRLLSSLPALWLQDSAERADASGIAHHPVPEVRRSIRRDEWPETHQHLLSAALSTAAYNRVPCRASGHRPDNNPVTRRNVNVTIAHQSDRGFARGQSTGRERRARPVPEHISSSWLCDTERSLLRRSREVASIGGGRTATYKNGIVRRLDNPLNLGVVERKFSEA